MSVHCAAPTASPARLRGDAVRTVRQENLPVRERVSTALRQSTTRRPRPGSGLHERGMIEGPSTTQCNTIAPVAASRLTRTHAAPNCLKSSSRVSCTIVVILLEATGLGYDLQLRGGLVRRTAIVCAPVADRRREEGSPAEGSRLVGKVEAGRCETLANLADTFGFMMPLLK